MIEDVDSFEVYADTDGTGPGNAANVASLQRFYTEVGGATYTGTYVALTGKCLFCPPTGDILKVLTPRNRWVIGFRMYIDAYPASSTTFYSNSALATDGQTVVPLTQAKLNPDGTISLYADANLIAQSTYIFPLNIWIYIELTPYYSIVSSTVQTTCQLYVNTVLVVGGATSTGVGTASLIYNDALANMHSLQSVGNTYFKDFYIMNTVGTVNVSRLGPVDIGVIFPNGDIVTDFTPSAAGTHYTLVNENPEDEDTTFVEDATISDQDIYSFQSISSFTGTIPAVCLRGCLRKTDNGNKALQIVTGATGSEDQSPSIYASGNYVWQRYVLDLDPATAMPWNVAGFNATDFGVRVSV